MRTWIARRYVGYTSAGRFWLTVGSCMLVVDMAIGYMAGVSVGTFWHGVGYAGLAAGFAFLPDAAYEECEAGRYGPAAMIALLCLPIGLKAYEQQLTYSAGVRHGEMQLTHYTNERADGAQDDVVRARAELKLLQGVLDKMQAEKPWSTTAKADGLRAEYDAIKDRMAKEEKGQRGRKAGKGKEFEALQDKANVIAGRIADIEKADDTQKRVQELQSIVDKKRDVANKTEHRQSVNVDVAKTTTKLINFMRGKSAEDAVRVDDVSMDVATMGSAGLGSMALLLLAPGAFFLAGRRRVKGYDETHEPTPPGPIAALLPTTPKAPVPAHGAAYNQGLLVKHQYDRSVHDALARLSETVGAATAPYRAAA